MRSGFTWIRMLGAIAAFALSMYAQAPPAETGSDLNYVLGPEDAVTIHVLYLEEIGNTPSTIDGQGTISVPLVGRVHAGGLRVEELETLLTVRLKEYLNDPVVTIAISTYRPQPVSVLGAVNQPGVHQIRGRKTLFEALSEAGGVKPEAGGTIKITRRKDAGPIPLLTAVMDPSGDFSVAEVSVKSIMEARNPKENIEVMAQDVISVPKADLVYILGAVKKAGGFVLSERNSVSVLQALSMAEGLDRLAAPARATILRPESDGNRKELPVDLKKVLEGKAPDVLLLANDVLVVPTSAGKTAAFRTIDALIQMGTQMAIYSVHP